MPLVRATRQERLCHFLLNLSAFSVCYLLGNALARHLLITRHAALAFESQIPFVPWMIVPYMSSGVFFCAVFWCVPAREQLRVLSQRLLLATVLAGLVFVLYPLQFGWPRPPLEHGIAAGLFGLLATLDQPYNQLPSLHVAYCLIFWQALRPLARSWGRALLAAWLVVMALATLFTYQHHVVDVAAGLLLGLLCVGVVRPDRSEPNVALHYLMSATVAAVVAFAAFRGLPGWHATLGLPMLYLGASLLLVSLAYYRRDRHFLRKSHGRHAWWVRLLYWPYLLGYRMTWLAVVRRERHKPPVTKVAHGLWVGRRLRESEADLLPPACTVFDLTPEITETAALRPAAMPFLSAGRRYFHFPLLDLLDPPPQVVHDIVTALREEIAAGRSVYLHCAMGYSRCILLANAYLDQNDK
jgi:membrane-associated phospholipid phosphatase